MQRQIFLDTETTGLRAEDGDAPAAWYPALTGELWPGESQADLWTEAAE